jgi:hypothetical protein
MEEPPHMAKTQTTQLAATHEIGQISSRPQNAHPEEKTTTTSTTTTAKDEEDEDQHQAAVVAVDEQSENHAGNEDSAHEVVDMEKDELQQENDSHVADAFQALLENGERTTAGVRPVDPVATKEMHDEELLDSMEKNVQVILNVTPQQKAISDEKKEIDTSENAVDPGRVVFGKTKENGADGLNQEEHASKESTNTSETKDTTDDMTKMETKIETTSDMDTSEIEDFVRQPHVVIGIKIHGPGHVTQLKQSLCLLKAAYNNRLNYDILLFVTEALSNNDARDLKEIVHPAHLIVETDKQTLSQQIAKMTLDQKQQLLQRCGKNSTDDLFWWTRCCDEDNHGDCMPLAYNWQAEFRSKWIWYSKNLAKYKWMMWYDSDAMATKVWRQDPVAFAIRHRLVMLFDHFPQGYRAHSELRGMMEDAYNGDYICDVKLVNGQLQAIRKAPGGCSKPKIPQIHGFFHITDLDFYRSDANLKWFNNMIGDRKFTRTWDDQLAVTVPAAVLAANRSWDMNSHGMVLDIYHNQHLDGDVKRRQRGGGFVHWWENNSNTSFPEAIEECSPFVKNSG